LRRVQTALAHGLVHGRGEEKRFIELFREDFHQKAVLIRFAVKGEQTLQNLHVLHDVIERFVFVRFGRLRLFFLLFDDGFFRRRFEPLRSFFGTRLHLRGQAAHDGQNERGQPDSRRCIHSTCETKLCSELPLFRESRSVLP
jgi:hypothetical protein